VVFRLPDRRQRGALDHDGHRQPQVVDRAEASYANGMPQIIRDNIGSGHWVDV
jgi:hypothetical protein